VEIQKLLFILALLSVSILLCVKFYFMRIQSHGRQDDGKEGYGFREILIHKASKTVSKTTSYLRSLSRSFVHSEPMLD